jgi:hypothetical protein
VGVPGFKQTLDYMLQLQEDKNHDYAQGGSVPFKNFELVEYMGVASVEQGLFVRLSDKYSRLASLLQSDAKVKDEKITDTLVDLANYAVILKCYLEVKNGKDNRSG